MIEKVTLEEQETVILILRDEDKASVYTCDTTMITKLNRLLEREDTEWKLVNRDEISMTVECPKNLISFRNKTLKRNLSDEQRAEMRERMKRIRDQ